MFRSRPNYVNDLFSGRRDILYFIMVINLCTDEKLKQNSVWACEICLYNKNEIPYKTKTTGKDIDFKIY